MQQPNNHLTFPRPFRRSQQQGCRDSSSTASSADAAVIATNDDAAISKASCVACGYFDDRFLRHFVGNGGGGEFSASSLLPRRPPLINRGYFCRHAAFTGLVDVFLSRAAEKKEEKETAIKTQIVSLGAGSDTLFFRLHESGRAPDLYIELDLPEVVSKKAALIASNPDLASRVGLDSSSSSTSFEGKQIVTSRYALLPCDLRSPRPVSTAIAKASSSSSSPSSSSSSSSSPFSFDPSSPTLFLSECVLVYLPVEAGDEVLRDASEMVAESAAAAIVVYDPCRPSTPFGRQMRQNLRARGCELAGFDAFENLRGAEERLRRCGWECGAGGGGSGFAESLRSVWERRLPEEARTRASRIEVLDELEEWNLIMEHYYLAVGVKGKEGSVFDGFGLGSLREQR